MGRKLNFTSLFFRANNGDTTPSSSSSLSSSSSSWAWPSCKNPRTDSFRSGPNRADQVYKTVNSVYFDSTDSFFSTQSSSSELECSESISAAGSDEESSETLIREVVRSDRLFFEPAGHTSSICDDRGLVVPFKESVAMAMESEDPYGDFRRSMEEMVAAHGLREWECLEELLVWYLRVNGKKNHGFIVGAFVDLLVGLASNDSTEEIENEKDVASSSCSNSMSSSAAFEIEEVKEEGGSC